MIIEKRKYSLIDIVRIPLKCAPVITILVGLQMLLSGIIPTIQIIVTANFINTAIAVAAEKVDIGMIYGPLFAVVALIAYTWVSGAFSKFGEVRLELIIREKFRTAVTEKRAKLDYKHIENHESWDLISRVSKNPETQLKTAYMELMSLAASIIRIIGILLLLINEVWWAALIIIAFSIPLFILAIKSGKANYEVNKDVTKYKRRYEYLSEVLTGREAVDERTLFGYGKRLGSVWHHQYEKARKITFKTESKWFIKMKAGSIITSLISILIVLVLLNPVLSGTVTIGMFISLVNAVFGLIQMMSWQLTYLVDQLAKHIEYLKDVEKFASLEETEGGEEKPASTPEVFKSLEFKNVKFKYPGSDNYILDGISFK